MSVSINTSRKLYEYIQPEFKRLSINGNSWDIISPVLCEYMEWNDFNKTSFKYFISKPQDRKSLINLIDDISESYEDFNAEPAYNILNDTIVLSRIEKIIYKRDILIERITIIEDELIHLHKILKDINKVLKDIEELEVKLDFNK